MKNKLQTLIAKFLGIESIIQAKCDALQRDYTRAVEEVAEKANNRISEVEDASEDYINKKFDEIRTELSESMESAVIDALDDQIHVITDDMVEMAVKKVLTKEYILSVLAK